VTAATESRFEAVLFDLDGTLVDTAPDMVAVLLGMQRDHGIEPAPYHLARSQVSNGAAGLIRLAFPDARDSQFEELNRTYLERYEAAVCVHSTLFPELDELLQQFESRRVPWGVVTNKPTRMTKPVLAGLDLLDRAACAVSGDTLKERKPHPAPLLLASRIIDTAPERIVYVGDASRDIEAGRAAGMPTVAVTYGYISEDDDPANWGADFIAADTRQLSQYLLQGVTLNP
jgi:2-phosphoglycolate phosphatase